MKRLMKREMLKDLIFLIESHKDTHPELYEYLIKTWVSCDYDSTLYACNVTGMTMSQQHLSHFDGEDERQYERELKRGVRFDPAAVYTKRTQSTRKMGCK